MLYKTTFILNNLFKQKEIQQNIQNTKVFKCDLISYFKLKLFRTYEQSFASL